MGRKTLNQFVKVQVASTRKIFKRFEVKLPFPVNVAYRQKNSENKIGFIVQNVNWLYSQRKQIIKKLDESGYEVDSIKQLTMSLSEFCPQCNRLGIPKVERKDTTDYHTRSGRYYETKTNLNKRNDEWWLTYDHKTKPRKCRIKQYQGRDSNTFKPNKFKQINFKSLMV